MKISTLAKVFSCRKDLVYFCKQLLPTKVFACEVGVFRGYFSKTLYDILNPEIIYLIDNSFDKFVSFKGNYICCQGNSYEELEKIPDEFLSFIYIDAGHSYEDIKRDIKQAHKKIIHHGIIQFNDYCNYDCITDKKYGVLKAVNEYIENYNVEIIGISLSKNGFHDLALKVNKNFQKNLNISKSNRPKIFNHKLLI